MCSCGCNTCETKITGPLLTEGKVKSLYVAAAPKSATPGMQPGTAKAPVKQ